MSKSKHTPGEIKSPCCCIGSGTEEFHVLLSDCPIKRAFGQRVVEKSTISEERREEVTCIYKSAFTRSITVPACEHYRGWKKKKGKEHGYFVICAAKLAEGGSNET